MQKGKLGICLPFYAVLGLVLAFLGQTLLCGILLGFVILAERDEWASRQTMQAFFLALFVSLVSKILDVLNVTQNIPLVNTVLNVVFGIVEWAIGIVVLIFIIIGLTRVVKGKDAGIPVMSKLANRAFGIVEQKVYTQPPVPPTGGYQPQQPQYQQPPYQQPVPPQNPQNGQAPQNPQNYQNPNPPQQ